MRIFFHIASILIFCLAMGFMYMAVESEKYWREKTDNPPAKK